MKGKSPDPSQLNLLPQRLEDLKRAKEREVLVDTTAKIELQIDAKLPKGSHKNNFLKLLRELQDFFSSYYSLSRPTLFIENIASNLNNNISLFFRVDYLVETTICPLSLTP